MIHRIEIVGLGPHRRFALELNPSGTTIVSGPSEIGKSTIVEALLLALLGKSSSGRFRAELINERSDQAGVRLTLTSGLIIERGVSRSKKMTRALITADKRRSISSDTALMREVAIAGQDIEIARMIMVPLSWQPMVAANARPFRDALARILPAADTAAVVTELMDEKDLAVSAEEASWDEKKALAARRASRKAQDEATGSLAALTAQRDRLQQPLPPAAGSAPPYDQAKAAEQSAAAALKAATEAWRTARRQCDALSSQLAPFDLSTPDRCPTCTRPGWLAGAQAVADLKKRLADAEAALAEATTAGTTARHDHNLAQQVLADSQRAAGAAEQRQADLRELEQSIVAAAATAQTQQALSARLDALVAAVRQAPSLLAARQAQSLGDLGPVSLTFGDNPAVRVQIDGRPWWLASRGRQVVADIHLRAALRRAARLQDLPIVIDNVQDVGGQPIPSIQGPVLILRTTDEPAISIQQVPSPEHTADDSTGQDD